MSFTEDVKNELARLLRRDKKCRRAELFGCGVRLRLEALIEGG